MKNLLACLLITLLVLPSSLMAQGQLRPCLDCGGPDDGKPQKTAPKKAVKKAKKVTSENSGVIDPYSVFKFTELPDRDYFNRSFVLKTNGEVKDLRGRDSDEIIRSFPQSDRGFLTGWLQEGQAEGSLADNTDVVMTDQVGKLSAVTLRKGESVVYSTTFNRDGTNDILAVVRCANKVTMGSLMLPPPEKVTEIRTVVKTVEVEKPVERIVEKEKLVYIQQPPPRVFQSDRRPVVEKKKSKKGLIIGGLVAGAVAAVLCAKFCGGGGKTPEKTYPTGGVIQK